jgi:hypothetical protein
MSNTSDHKQKTVYRRFKRYLLSLLILLCGLSFILAQATPVYCVKGQGSGSKITLLHNPYSMMTNGYSFSFHTWVKLATYTGYGFPIFDFNYGGGTGGRAVMYIAGTTNSYFPRGTIVYTVYGASNRTTTGVLPNDTNWHMIDFVATQQSGTTYTQKFYIDGVLDSTTNQTWYQVGDTNPRLIGATALSGSWIADPQMSIDETGFWVQKELQQADINALWASGAGHVITQDLTHLKAGWHFDEGTGTTAADFSGNSNTGTISQSFIWDTGKVPSPLVCGIDHCDLCLDQTTCLNATCYWYQSACHLSPLATCTYESCYSCTDQFDCIYTCGINHWYNNLCNQNTNPNCVISDLLPQVDSQYMCLHYQQYWSDFTKTTGQYCYRIKCSAPPPQPIETNECGGSTTSTVSFIYTNYTTDWTQPTDLFAGIFSVIGNIADPIFCWFQTFFNFFDNQKAATLGVNTAASLGTIVANVKAFDNIFGTIPIGETLILLILVFVVKGFFNLATKVIGIIKP